LQSSSAVTIIGACEQPLTIAAKVTQHALSSARLFRLLSNLLIFTIYGLALFDGLRDDLGSAALALEMIVDAQRN